MATHSSTLAWKIRWMEEPGKLQGLQNHTRLSNFTVFLAEWLFSLRVFQGPCLLLSCGSVSCQLRVVTLQPADRERDIQIFLKCPSSSFLLISHWHSLAIWQELEVGRVRGRCSFWPDSCLPMVMLLSVGGTVNVEWGAIHLCLSISQQKHSNI